MQIAWDQVAAVFFLTSISFFQAAAFIFLWFVVIVCIADVAVAIKTK